jgi:hypothetical protein
MGKAAFSALPPDGLTAGEIQAEICKKDPLIFIAF